jgi:hypothetical protein
MPKIARKVAGGKKAPVAKKAVVAAAKPEKTVRPARPAVAKYSFNTGYKKQGGTKGLNTRPSRQPINFKAFGSIPDAALTDRDHKLLKALREQFASKEFERANLDTGILRRLGERGFIKHVSGTEVAPDATFKLTGKTA